MLSFIMPRGGRRGGDYRGRGNLNTKKLLPNKFRVKSAKATGKPRLENTESQRDEMSDN